MSLLDNPKFRPTVYKDYPKPVQSSEPRVKTTSSVQNYNAYDQDPSSHSSRGLQFQIDPPSYSTVINRAPRLATYFDYKVTFTVTNHDVALNSDLLSPQLVALRDNPLNRLFVSPRMTINNEQVSVDLGDQFQAQNLMSYDEDYATAFNTPSNIDLGILNYPQANGSNSTPLAGYKNMTLGSHFVPDGAFMPYAILDPSTGNPLSATRGDSYETNGVTLSARQDNYYGNATQLSNTSGALVNGNSYVVVFRYYLEATPWISPLVYNGMSGSETEGIYGVKQMRLNLDLAQSPKIMRNDDTVPVGGGQLRITGEDYHTDPWKGGCTFHYLSMEPPYDLNLPKVNTLPMYRFESSTRHDGSGINAGQQKKFYSDELQIGTIPDMLFISCRLPREDLTPRQADFHLVPESLSVRIGNQTNLLRTFSQTDLYHIARKYIPIDWQTFTGQGLASDGSIIPLVSCPIPLKLGEDLELQPGLAAGVNTHTNIKVEMEVRNQTTEAISAVELSVLRVEPQFLYNSQGASQVFWGFLTESDVLNARVWDEEQPIDQKIGGKRKGKSLLGALGHGISKMGTQLGKKALEKGADKAVGKAVNKALK